MTVNLWIKKRKIRERLGKDFASEAEFAFVLAEESSERFPELEEKIAHSAHFSYLYACKLNERFLIGEEAISKEHRYSYLYAKNIIKGRFEVGEKVILENTRTANSYYCCFLDIELPESFKIIHEECVKKFLKESE